MAETDKDFLRESPIEYRVIQMGDSKWSILIHKEDIDNFGLFLTANGCEKTVHSISEDNRYDFRYQLEAPCLYKKNASYIDVFTKLPCASLTDRVFIPLDEQIQNAAWDKYDMNNGIYLLAPEVFFLYTLTFCVFTKKKFDHEDVLYFDMNRKWCKDEYTIGLLKKVFFSFTDKLVLLLYDRKYHSVFGEYIRYKEY